MFSEFAWCGRYLDVPLYRLAINCILEGKYAVLVKIFCTTDDFIFTISPDLCTCSAVYKWVRSGHGPAIDTQAVFYSTLPVFFHTKNSQYLLLTTRQIPINCIFKPVFGMKLHKKRMNLPLFALIMHKNTLFLRVPVRVIKMAINIY